MANLLDIPHQCRGTVKIGEQLYHYERSVKTGDMMLVNGPDRRDWAAIDNGALDYSVIAQQEHAVPGFVSHDGPKITSACPICTGAAIEGAAALRDPAVAAAALAGTARQETTTGPAPDPASLPPEQQAELALAQAERRLQAAQEEAAALKYQQDKANAELARLRGQATRQAEDIAAQQVTGAADPARNAGLPPTDPDVIAGATPDIQAQAVTLTEHGPGEPVVHTAALTVPDGHGIDPWTKQVVPITRNPGADADAPYGRKKDGEPRRAPGKPAASDA